jgi:hypothetical protein
MAFRPLKAFGGLLDRMVPSTNYGGLLSPADERAAADAYRATLASGLLSMAGPQTRPVSLGQAFAAAIPQATAARDQRAEVGLRNEQMRREIERENRQTEARQKFSGLLSSMGATDEEKEMLGLLGEIATPQAAEGLLSSLFAKQEAPAYESPIGKLLADRDLADGRNDAAAVSVLDEAIAKEIGASGADLSEVLRVRNDVTRNSAEFLAAQTGFDKVLAAAGSDTPAGDMSLIFGFMKVLDPGSIVREGEFANVQNSAGVPEQIRGVYNRVLRGERLTPEQRQDFTYQARQQFEPMIERQQRLVRDAEAFAKRNKLPFEDIVPEYVMPLLPAPMSPPPERDPAEQIPTLLDQVRRDFGGLFAPRQQTSPQLPPLPPGATLDPE